MRILFIGDVVGRTGRDALAKQLPIALEKLRPDVVIVNGENAAHGIGITPKICEEMYALGVHVITTGNHVWDQREIIPYIGRDPKLLRPLNFPKAAPGNGMCVHVTEGGQKIAVINLMARLFMDAMDDPFAKIDDVLQTLKMGINVSAIFVDFHGEATSEKMALAQYLDGRVTAVVGTHTHLPTADAQIFPGGTAFQADAGMTADYNSVIGVRADISVTRFIRKMPGEKMVPAEGEGTMCGTFIVADDQTGKAVFIDSVILGPRLKNNIPAV
jgi:metallophosphoesterase (TIGR00282 family)